MPANNNAKIALARKIASVLLVIILSILLTLTVSSLFHKDSNTNFNCLPKSLNPEDSSCIFFEYALSHAQRQQGLSGRGSMRDDQGMLFIFEEQGKHCFWMKDMHFAIDIVWLSEEKKIIHKQENVTPESYPENFCPPEPARYAIEVNAGIAKNWILGQSIPF